MDEGNILLAKHLSRHFHKDQKYGDSEFRCGTGFNDVQRQEIWSNQESYLGKLASIRYMSVGSKDLPYVPSFIGFRDKDDI